MDSHNLATLFGPNILHKAKVTEKEFMVECTEQAEQSKEVIEVIKDMIDNHHEIFEVSPRDFHISNTKPLEVIHTFLKLQSWAKV